MSSRPGWWGLEGRTFSSASPVRLSISYEHHDVVLYFFTRVFVFFFCSPVPPSTPRGDILANENGDRPGAGASRGGDEERGENRKMDAFPALPLRWSFSPRLLLSSTRNLRQGQSSTLCLGRRSPLSQRRRLGGTNAETDDGWAAGPNELMDGCIRLPSELVPFFVFALQHHLKNKENTSFLLLQSAQIL